MKAKARHIKKIPQQGRHRSMVSICVCGAVVHASVFQRLSLESHLLVHIAWLSVLILGWYLSGPTGPFDTDVSYKRPANLFRPFLLLLRVPVYHIRQIIVKRFPRKFALFPIRPISHRPTYTPAAFA